MPPGVDAYPPARLRSSISALGLLLVVNSIVPFITLPYLARVLGTHAFGQVAFVQAAMAYVALVCDFAFSLSATQQIAGHRDDRAALSRIFTSVWTVQWLLTLIAAAALAIYLAVARPPDELVRQYAWGFVALVVANAMTPAWFFQGLERMQELVVVQVLGRLLAVPFIFMLVASPADAWLVLAVQGGTALLAGACAIAQIVGMRVIQWRFATVAEIGDGLRMGYGLFLSKLSVSLYTALPPVALGVVAGPVAVGYFTLADRLRTAGQSLLTPVAQALFPRLSYLYQNDVESARRLAWRSLALTSGIAAVVSFALFALAWPAVKVVGGGDFHPAVGVLQVLAVLPIVVGLSNVFGIQIMLPSGRIRSFNLILGAGAALGVVTIWPLAHALGAMGAALSIVAVECFVTLAMATYLLNHSKLWRSK